MSTPTLLPAIKVYPYLTICPDRRPKQKVHTSLGHAKNAIIARDNWGVGLREDCAIYEWQDNQWHLLFEIPKGTCSRSMPWHNKEI